jgi:hypothetical protein
MLQLMICLREPSQWRAYIVIEESQQGNGASNLQLRSECRYKAFSLMRHDITSVDKLEDTAGRQKVPLHMKTCFSYTHLQTVRLDLPLLLRCSLLSRLRYPFLRVRCLLDDE